jgi:hypothetical protein
VILSAAETSHTDVPKPMCANYGLYEVFLRDLLVHGSSTINLLADLDDAALFASVIKPQYDGCSDNQRDWHARCESVVRLP